MMTENTFTNVVGALVGAGGAFFMAYWMSQFIRENGRPGKWVVWFCIVIGVLIVLSLIFDVLS